MPQSQVTGKFDKTTLTVFLSGRIDTTNASDAQADIDALRDAHPETEAITLDADALEYISSAGLRVILRLLKVCKNVKMINVCLEVYEIFETTGFTEMMDIKKAFRKLDLTGCEVIGKGACGEVYRYDEETIVKTYHRDEAMEEMELNRRMSRKALIAGLPTAIPYDIVKVEGGYGTVYELLNATSITKLIARDPDNIADYVGQHVELMRQIHATPIEDDEIPDMNGVARGWINDLKPHLPEDVWQKVSDMIAAIPTHKFLLHGDYHTNNVMVQNGEALLIDMDTLAYGHPVYELASVYNAYVGFSLTDPTRGSEFFKLPQDVVDKIWPLFMELYVGNDPAKREEIENKASLLGMVRLLRRTIRHESDNEPGQKLIAASRAKLCELAAKVNELTYEL